MDEPERLTRGTDAQNESSYSRSRASRDIFAQKTQILDAWTQDLGDHDHEDVGNIDEDIKIEDEESELDRERAYTKDCLT